MRLADRADPLPGVGRVDQEGGRPGLGHAHAVADADAEVAAGERERVGQRRAAAAPVADMIERRRGEAGMIEQALIDGRHREQGVEPPRLEQADQPLGVEPVHHDHPAAGDQGRQRVEVDPGGVEDGQEGQACVSVEARPIAPPILT